VQLGRPAFAAHRKPASAGFFFAPDQFAAAQHPQNEPIFLPEFIMSAAPVAIAVFEFLDSTHQEIQSQIKLLHALVDAIESDGLNQATRGQARRVLDYFNGEARQHHLDEEKHIFPALLASQNAEIVQAAEHLIQDHGWLEENWIQIAPSLEAATGGNLWFDPMELRHALEVFEALYLDHIILEESIAYPEAKKRLMSADTSGMGREMAKRRALQRAEVRAKA
jgi:hemerythrin-like domain-containing protein